jgi:hypothetical protein
MPRGVYKRKKRKLTPRKKETAMAEAEVIFDDAPEAEQSDMDRRMAAIAEADGGFNGEIQLDGPELHPETGIDPEAQQIAEDAERKPFIRAKRTTPVGEFPDDEPIIGLTQHAGTVYIASPKHIYKMQGRNHDRLVRMRFEFRDEGL